MLGYILGILGLIIPSTMCAVFGVLKHRADKKCNDLQVQNAEKDELVLLMVENQCATQRVVRHMANGLLANEIINGGTAEVLAEMQSATTELKQYLRKHGVKQALRNGGKS
ncbi:MAG: hypothetical protein FWE40_05530 [Oscillospiraceae bacterium]|nr:hypothetical protein [Oscillospiraceae bacterium]